jgi:hypothetical protein
MQNATIPHAKMAANCFPRVRLSERPQSGGVSSKVASKAGCGRGNGKWIHRAIHGEEQYQRALQVSGVRPFVLYAPWLTNSEPEITKLLARYVINLGVLAIVAISVGSPAAAKARLIA